MFQTIAILGSGTIGASWAAFYSLQGLNVKLYDIDIQQRQSGYQKALGFLDAILEHQLADHKKVEAAKKRLKIVETIEALAEDADYVQESIIERLDIKQAAYAQLEKFLSSEAIIASSSSGLCMTQIQQVLKYPQRSLIAHPFNPPHLVPLVELVAGKETDKTRLDQVYTFFESLGKIPIVLKKEVPGHIANRLSAALWREAMDLVGQGVANVEDIDKALYAGPGLRWSFMGSHLTYHLGGGEGGYPNFMEHLAPAFENWLADMAVWTKVPDEAKNAALEGIKNSVGEKSIQELERWRDENLTTLLKVLYPSDEK
jgi:carnitine 3-dehydrogenase